MVIEQMQVLMTTPLECDSVFQNHGPFAIADLVANVCDSSACIERA